MTKIIIIISLSTILCSCTTIRTEHYIKLDHHITVDINATNINLNMNHTHEFKDNNSTTSQRRQAIRKVENMLKGLGTNEETQNK